MKKINRRSLSKTLIALIVLVLVTVIIFAFTYAKYVSNAELNEGGVSARPAAFELIMGSDSEPEIRSNFAAVGEPGSPLGYSEAYKQYDFKVRSTGSEVTVDYNLEIIFSPKLYAIMVDKNSEDRFNDGIWFSYEVYGEDAEGNFQLLDITSDPAANPSVKTEVNAKGELVWRYSVSKVLPGYNPNGTTDGDVDYKLCLTVYNNTLMPDAGNTEDYVMSTDGIEIKVSSKQITADSTTVNPYENT